MIKDYLERPYYEYNREERNLTAMLYALISEEDNARRFLDLIGMADSFDRDTYQVYYEYAVMRDIWNLAKTNEARKSIIRECLPIEGIESLLAGDAGAVNERFGVVGRRSGAHIVSPGNWGISAFSGRIRSDKDFKNACYTKWVFKIKPDIVIVLGSGRAVCVEAKWESGEGQYPSLREDKEIYRARCGGYARQLDIQKYLMETVLGFNTSYLFIDMKGSATEGSAHMSWNGLFRSLRLDRSLPFARNSIESLAR